MQCVSRSAAAFKLQRYADALADAEKAIGIDSDFVKAYLRRATAHSSLEDYEAAIRDYEKVNDSLSTAQRPQEEVCIITQIFESGHRSCLRQTQNDYWLDLPLRKLVGRLWLGSNPKS